MTTLEKQIKENGSLINSVVDVMVASRDSKKTSPQDILSIKRELHNVFEQFVNERIAVVFGEEKCSDVAVYLLDIAASDSKLEDNDANRQALQMFLNNAILNDSKDRFSNGAMEALIDKFVKVLKRMKC